MHSSWFSYAITRPYPFRWFTPVAITGGIALTVLFTIINLASSGFYLKPVLTENPNGTIAQSARWFMEAPFNWDNNLETNCQPKMLSVGDRFFTTNLGLQYSIKAITQNGNASEVPKSYPSIPYLNNTLEGCYLTQVDIHLRKSDARASASWWLSWITSFSTATASCTFMSSMGLVDLSLGLEYSGEGNHIYPYVIQDDFRTHASTWWGTRLLNAYFTGVLTTMSRTQSLGDENFWMTGRVSFTRNLSNHDLRDPKFFDLEAWFLSSNGFRQSEELNDTAFIHNTPERRFVPVVSESLHYARLLHSLVAADLGNRQSPNLLLDGDRLQYAILPPDDPNRKLGSILNDSLFDGQHARYSKIPAPGSPIPPRDKDLVLLNETYIKFADQMGPLGSNNATIVMQYLCSVPQSKSPGVMVLAIVLANMVFLEAAWKLLTWIAEGMLPDSQTMTCQGCSENQDRAVVVESIPSDTKSGGSYSRVRIDEEA